MYRKNQLVIVTAARTFKHFPDLVEYITFGQYVKPEETPKQAADRRAKELCELYKWDNLEASRIKVVIEKENIETGHSVVDSEYFL